MCSEIHGHNEEFRLFFMMFLVERSRKSTASAVPEKLLYVRNFVSCRSKRMSNLVNRANKVVFFTLRYQ